MFDLEKYRFAGAGVSGSGKNVKDAVDDLADYWGSRPTLTMHGWGVVSLSITIGSTEATFEVSSNTVLDAMERGDMGPLYDMMARHMGISREDAELVLSQSSHVEATVDRIRPKSRPRAWKPAPGTHPSDVLPRATVAWIGDIGRDIDREVRRDQGRPRSRRGQRLLRMVVQTGMDQDLSNAEIARQTGLPRSTVRDARMRFGREKKAVAAFEARRPGQRLTSTQRTVVLDKLKETGNNAAAAARDLGLPPRTVRDIRNRAVKAKSVGAPAAPRRQYTPSDKEAFFKAVRSRGLSATAAGRELGIPGRTARGWLRRRIVEKDTT